MPAGRPPRKTRGALGQNIADARKQKGLTQLELAEILGLTQQGVAYMERSATSLKPEQLIAIAEALDTSTDFLLGRKTKQTRGSGPEGRGRRLFEAASKLPRSKREKVYDVLESFVKEHSA
jgi:transcriptional regulator with XRE-family HTH domain